MNRFYLIIPAIGDGDAGQDIAYLKKLGEIDNDGVLAILKRIVGSMELVKEEDFEVLYDNRHFNRLLQVLDSEPGKQEMPQRGNLLVFFNDAVSIQQRKLGNTPVYINGMTVESGLINAYVDGEMTGEALLNKDALANPEQPIDVRRIDGGQLLLNNSLTCDSASVYLWLVEHRAPRRQLDSSYEKHGKKEKSGRRGVRISALTYTGEQLNEFLKRAVVARKGLRELYYKDKSQNKIIIFWNENLQEPFYHAMETADDNMEEIQKIYKRGGSALMKRIEDTSALFQ